MRQLQLLEDPINGTNSITLQAPALVPANVVLTFPPTAGSVNQILTTDGFGNLSWTTLSVPGGVIFNGGNSFGAPITIGTNDNYALNLETFGSNRLTISNTGLVTIANLAAAGVVHTDNFGDLSTSLIVDADITTGTITDDKLATITTAGKVANSATTATSLNTPNTIVARDSSGDFAAGIITANLIGSASNNVLKAGDTMTGNLLMSNQSQIQLQELTINGASTVSLQAPASFSPSYTLTFPTNAGSSNQVLTTDGAGNLSWKAAATVGAIVNGGNSFGAPITIGTNDNFAMNLETDGIDRIQISNTGAVTINNLAGSGARYVQTDALGDLSAVIPTGITNVVQVIQNSPTVTGEYYSDIKSAVDWANANATEPTAIVINAGTYTVSQTITATNANIRSISGTFATKVVPAASLAGNPVFVLAQAGALEPFEIRGFVIDGTGVAGWSSTPGSINIQITGSGQFSINRMVVLNAYQGIVTPGAASPLQQSITVGECAVGFTGDCGLLCDNGANVIILNSLFTAPGTQLVRAQQTNASASTTMLIIGGGKYTNDLFLTGQVF